MTGFNEIPPNLPPHTPAVHGRCRTTADMKKSETLDLSWCSGLCRIASDLLMVRAVNAGMIAASIARVDCIRRCRTISLMNPLRTIAETALFQSHAAAIWSDDDLTAFKVWLAANPDAGDVVPGSGRLRKVRWARRGMGRRGGARVIYFIEHQGCIWLLMAYTKSKYDNLSVSFLARLKKEVQDAQEH